ncbi:putative c6 zinc finger domain containing protein [Phaeoacremonium minimum UCRPA7]|uniref:Putative c6 zinc finger domain containing protein n=1 Tax=Phaeoacremonium minimum (strain UCR-PA7) TaxID=1286976 RepID=R8BIL2_PHAM7|nr:putative c6 zinc finger domain containing protein [Phaeoacremonium minimum UCRPA7]EON99114.1 putative c6 zinc finger domain containing protein [Phaeoacremonium minimum UCRPA7]
MQNLPHDFDPTRIQLPVHQQACELVGQWVAAATTVTSDDEMIGCGEGIEILILLSMFQAEGGQLRRAWMTTRRALDLARVLGIDRPTPPPVPSCATAKDPKATPSMSILWYRLNCSDRYHSVILGLTPASYKDNFLHVTPISSDKSFDMLNKAHAAISRKIADRNDLPPRSDEAYSATQSIEREFEQAMSEIERSWWDIPVIPKATLSDLTFWRRSTSQLMSARSAMYTQVRHYTLLILLHLPYLLRDKDGGKHSHNRLACMSASRAVLERFLAFRKGNILTIAGRPIDYSALIAGMTLLLGHLGPGTGHDMRQADRDLVEGVLITFRELAEYKRDRLATESGETLSQLLPIIMNNSQEPVSLTVPFLGTVSINPRPAPATGTGTYDAGHNCVVFPHPMSLQHPLLSDFDLDPRPVLSFEAAGMNQVHPSGMGNVVDGNMEDRSSYLTSNLEDWVFQGIDTTYWSTLNESMNVMAGK